MPRDSISREPCVPKGESPQGRSFRRTYPLVAAGHLLALVLVLVLAKFVSSRPPPPAFFFPLSGSDVGSGAHAPPRVHPAPSPSPGESRTPLPMTKAEPPEKAIPPVSKPPPLAAKPPPSAAMARKHIEPARKPSIRPNLVEVTRRLPAGEAPAKPPPVIPHRAEAGKEPIPSQPKPPGGGEGGGPTSNPPSLGSSWYYALIRDRLYAAWDQPLHLSSQNLVAKVQIFVAKDGHISKPVLLNSSDNEEFDRTVLAATHQVETVGEPRPSDVPEIVTVTFRMLH